MFSPAAQSAYNDSSNSAVKGPDVQAVHETVEILIVGAGICGVTAAAGLPSDKAWTLLDKSRSVGGRMATRRVAGERFDHGAQFFTARSDTFKGLVSKLHLEGVVREWVKGFKTDFDEKNLGDKTLDGHPRYIGTAGMNQVVKHLAARLNPDHVRVHEKIVSLELMSGRFNARCESGASFSVKKVLLTMPLPQVVPLIATIPGDEHLDDIKRQLERINYDPCVAVMAFFDAAELPLSSLPIQAPEKPLAFLSDNHSKGLSSVPGSLTIHLSPDASRGVFAAGDDFVLDFVCDQLKTLTGKQNITKPTVYEVHRWRYATPQSNIAKPFLAWSVPNHQDLKLVIAGEAFGGPKIEGAYLSGLAAGLEINKQS